MIGLFLIYAGLIFGVFAGIAFLAEWLEKRDGWKWE